MIGLVAVALIVLVIVAVTVAVLSTIDRDAVIARRGDVALGPDAGAVGGQQTLADRDIVALQGRIDLVASRCRACQRRDANAAMAMILVVIMLPLLSDQPVRPHAGGAGRRNRRCHGRHQSRNRAQRLCLRLAMR